MVGLIFILCYSLLEDLALCLVLAHLDLEAQLGVCKWVHCSFVLVCVFLRHSDPYLSWNSSPGPLGYKWVRKLINVQFCPNSLVGSVLHLGT